MKLHGIELTEFQNPSKYTVVSSIKLLEPRLGRMLKHALVTIGVHPAAALTYIQVAEEIEH